MTKVKPTVRPKMLIDDTILLLFRLRIIKKNSCLSMVLHPLGLSNFHLLTSRMNLSHPKSQGQLLKIDSNSEATGAKIDSSFKVSNKTTRDTFKSIRLFPR
jgi:hypothetical protein